MADSSGDGAGSEDNSVFRGGNVKALHDEEERQIELACKAREFARAKKLADQALLDPTLSLYCRVKYEVLLSILPDRNPWHHIKKAKYVLRIAEEYIEMVESQHKFIEKVKTALASYGRLPPEPESLEEGDMCMNGGNKVAQQKQGEEKSVKEEMKSGRQTVLEEYFKTDENPAQQNLDFVKDQHLFIDDLKNDIRTEGDWPEESEIDNAVDKHKPNKRGRESDGEKEERDVKKSKFVEDDSVA
ncbi:hypothetical protein HDK77DRAFT_481733 [Phyllosticta capitalensis]